MTPRPNTNRLALITNDDGVGSTGIRVLARAAATAGLDVIVAAPVRDLSGASAALTATVEENGRFVIDEVAWDDEPVGVKTILALDAAPSFIVRAALGGAFGPTPDLVLSGVNHGPNTGHSVLHSGTVGAALTASTHGRPAMAVSMGAGSPTHWDTAAEVIDLALDWLLGRSGPVVLNVNVPNVPISDLKGFRQARLATYGAVQARVIETGKGFAKLTYGDVDAKLEPGTDAAMLADGFACFTPLQSVSEASGIDTGRLETREIRVP